jgi:hypothetical protein
MQTATHPARLEAAVAALDAFAARGKAWEAGRVAYFREKARAIRFAALTGADLEKALRHDRHALAWKAYLEGRTAARPHGYIVGRFK